MNLTQRGKLRFCIYFWSCSANSALGLYSLTNTVSDIHFISKPKSPFISLQVRKSHLMPKWDLYIFVYICAHQERAWDKEIVHHTQTWCSSPLHSFYCVPNWLLYLNWKQIIKKKVMFLLT